MLIEPEKLYNLTPELAEREGLPLYEYFAPKLSRYPMKEVLPGSNP